METHNVTYSCYNFIFEKPNLIQFFTLSFPTANVENVRQHFECEHEDLEPSFLTHFATLFDL